MTFAPSRSSARAVRVRTRELPAGVDLLAQLPSSEDVLAWVRGGDGLVGWGVAAEFRCSGPDRFAAADAWWRELQGSLDVEDEVGLPGTGAVAFVSMAFAAGAAESVLVVPRVILGQRGGRVWRTEVGGASATPVLPVRGPGVVRYAEGRHSVTRYREAVRTAVRRMRDGELAKVVLAHDLLATAAEPFDPRFLLAGLARRYPSCWAYAVAGLVGATPELLLRRNGSDFSSRVLAGTMWPRPGITEDELAAELLASGKNREEHAYAVRSFVDRLGPLCAELDAPATPEVLRLRNVLHLSTDVRGRLHDDGSLLRLAEAVHPTAAVGGTPTPDAVRLIAELEGMDRGRYAGPVGWIDGAGDGELGVALRCAQLAGNTARLFAGCGIVADSDPDTEVAEAGAKMIPVRDALEGA
ncbi:isochorismate synthase [Crossiella cryophila]|uniref:isochorismate synthase n=1 Tax=Crossiella cryophila TaxID=43355 RepID=A0A7W7C4Q1_9PSEU|nr:isochorismate synthase [Crossiella cryophila]MBB4674447.1 menaquinone-specific isochorismate synthase [Crossiella cryophila]